MKALAAVPVLLLMAGCAGAAAKASPTVTVVQTETPPTVEVTKVKVMKLKAPTVTKTVTKTVTATHTVRVTVKANTGPKVATKPRSGGYHIGYMDITWGCNPTAGCHYGLTSWDGCRVWIHAPSNLIYSVKAHEYIHVLQCRAGQMPNERVADAGALLLGATWTNYTSSPTASEYAAARRLLEGA